MRLGFEIRGCQSEGIELLFKVFCLFGGFVKFSFGKSELPLHFIFLSLEFIGIGLQLFL
jgi:hypothetical protein